MEGNMRARRVVEDQEVPQKTRGALWAVAMGGKIFVKTTRID
jgi:hypothetical protein